MYLDGDTVTFDMRIKTRDGWVSGSVDIMPNPGKYAKDERSLIATEATHDVNECHAASWVIQMSKLPGQQPRILVYIKLTGKFQKCEDCVIAKAHQKNVKKTPSKKAKHPGGRISLDISSPEYKGVSGKRHWLLFLGEHLDLCWSHFPK